MIRAAGVMGDRRVLLLGLTTSDMALLMAGRPMVFDAAGLGVDAQVAIVGGETEDEMVAGLRREGLMTPDATVLRID